MYKKEDKHATIAISVVQLNAQQAVVRSCLGWRLGECLYPCQSRSIVKSRDRWRGWPTLCLSACQSTHHSPTTSTATESQGRTTVFYSHLKKTRGTDSSKCDTLTLDFLLKTQDLLSNTRQLTKRNKYWLYPKTTKTSEAEINKHILSSKTIWTTHYRAESKFCIYIAFKYLKGNYNPNLAMVKSSPC